MPILAGEDRSWGSEPLKVGVLFSSTGVTASVERTQAMATMLAIDEINRAGGVAGRRMEAVAYDPQANPKLYRAHAQQLLQTDGVRIVFGCYMSSARKAVLPVIEALDALLVYPTHYEGFEYSPNCFYTGAVPNQNLVPLAKYILSHHGNRLLLVGSNYVFPYESNRIFSDLIVEAGGQIVDELYVPLAPEPADFERTLRQIERHRPDAIFSTLVGSGTAMFYEAHARARPDAGRIPIASLTTSEAEVAEMSAEAAEGHLTAAPYFESLDTPANRAFLGAYRARFGSEHPVTASAEAAYYQVHLVAAALASCRSQNRRDVMEALRFAEFDAPQGLVKIDPENNHSYLWPRVARIDAERRFEIVWDPHVRIKPDPYFVSVAMDDWSAGGRIAKVG